MARVKFVKSAQRLGFRLEEIAGLLRLEDGTHCDEARVMAEQKLDDVRSKLRDLRRMESALKRLVANCCASQGTITCSIIAGPADRRPGAIGGLTTFATSLDFEPDRVPEFLIGLSMPERHAQAKGRFTASGDCG